MLQWISKVLGAVTTDLPAGVPPSWPDDLQSFLAQLDKLPAARARPGLAADIISFVLRGEPVAVLAELPGQEAVANQLGLSSYGAPGETRDRRESLYKVANEVPTPVLLRWAQVLEASINKAGAFVLPFPNAVHWPEALLMHVAGDQANVWTSARPEARWLSVEIMERLFAEAGMEPSALLAAAFADPLQQTYHGERRPQLIADLKGYGAAFDRHIEALRPLLLPSALPRRLHVLMMLAKLPSSSLPQIAGELSELAASSSKQVRIAAEPLLRKCGPAAYPSLKIHAQEGKPEQRLNALRLLWTFVKEHGDAELESFARTTALADKAPSIQALPQEWDAGAVGAATTVNYEYAIPTIDWSGALTPDLSRLLDEMWPEFNAAVAKANHASREHHTRMVAQGHNYALHLMPEYSAADLQALRAYIQSDQPRLGKRDWSHHRHAQFITDALIKRATAPGMSAAGMLKILTFFDAATHHDKTLLYQTNITLNALHRTTGRPTLLELGLMLSDLGVSAAALLQSYCSAWGASIAKEWSNEAVWPFFAHHLELLTQWLQTPPKDYSFDRNGLFRAIATLPSPTPALADTLFELALGPTKSTRLPAQTALANYPDKEQRIIHALTHGKSEVRAEAAIWLGRLRHAPAQEALERSVLKENHDLAKGAMLDALSALGQPVEKYLDRKALQTQATKSLSKGLPKDLDWFPWNALPEVRWADGSGNVTADTLRWLLLQAFKQKSPEPNAVLRKYCTMFEPRDREKLGQFVLESWLVADVEPVSSDEAQRLAAADAQSTHASMQSYPQYYADSPLAGRSVAELIAHFLPARLRQPKGSVISSKGVLAVAGACAGQAAAAPVARYLKDHYGNRAAQGKALIAMLAWIEHPSATQLMLSIGNRFRTKSFQQEATLQAEALAERKGWTLSELADRTIPSGGFDETSTLELSYGMRVFTAKLLPDFKVELFNPDGKKIASLPEPRQDDDAERAKEAKKAFSAAKKEIKSIVDLQTDRLYEALCTGRDWTFEDWNLYLFQHPVVRRLVQQLVWLQVDDGRVVQSFRPLDDGTLTNRDDDEVTLAADARVCIAHDSLLPPEEVAQWQQHLVDYKVAPLFQQLGKGVYTLPDGKVNDNSITDFEGHLIEAFTLRGRALKLGYTRGPAEDGGWFHIYEKRFPTLGLVANIEFTGNPLPEENRTVALLSLAFSNAAAQSYDAGNLPLSKVPKVLLSECYNDVRLIAAEGAGFDPEWRKKSEY